VGVRPLNLHPHPHTPLTKIKSTEISKSAPEKLRNRMYIIFLNKQLRDGLTTLSLALNTFIIIIIIIIIINGVQFYVCEEMF
jgi:hypothetical protein